MPRPGWLLRTPAAWRAQAPAGRGELPEPYAAWVAQGRALAFPYRNRQAVWPLQCCPGTAAGEPVPGIAPLIRPAAALRSETVASFIEATLIDWNHEFDEDPSLPIRLDLPADKAQAFGFITGQQKLDAMAEARRATLKCIDDALDEFKDFGHDEETLKLLREVRGSIREFRHRARQFDKRIAAKVTQVRAAWRWPGPSVAASVLDGTRAEVVECLAGEAHRRSGLLVEYAQHEAWQQAFDRYGRRM